MSDQEHEKRHVEVPFVMVPLAIARIRSLSGGAKLLFGAIYSLSHLPNGCHCSNESLATRIGLSTEQVRRLLRELESRELIVRTLKDHGRSDIRVVWRGKPIKMSDKKSGRPKGDTKCIGGEGDTKCPDKKYPPPRVRASASGDFNEKKKKRSEPSGSESVSSKKKPPNARPGDASAVQKEEDPESLGPRLTDEEYAAKLLATLRRQAWVNGKPPDYRWDATSKVWRFNGPDWLLPLLQSVQGQVLAILDGERAAKESQP
jgi:hypothetical protein